MRVLLDEQLSPRYVGDPLRRLGHDVVCVAADHSLRGSRDDELLAFAAADRRVLVTRNSRHFNPLAREWAGRGRAHAGLLLVWSRETDEFGQLVDEIAEALAAIGDQKAWENLTRAL